MSSHILVVDDEKGIRMTFSRFLSDEGHKVLTASSYEEALKIISLHDFDLIFADIVMGEKNGIDLLKIIKEGDILSPVIMISGFPSLKTAAEAVRLGAFDYISKPVYQDNLLQITNTALKHKALIDEKEKYRFNLEAIFQSVDEGIVTVDRNLRIIEVNDAARKVCKIFDDFLGEYFQDAIKCYHFQECLAGLKKTVETKEPVKLDRIECCEDKIVTVKINPLREKKNKFSGAVMVIRDETFLVKMEKRLKERRSFYNITGRNYKMQKIYSQIEKLSDLPTTVLITGESGTGKELVAEALHYEGLRKIRPFIKVNCSALPENLIESELFGHMKGAFTGAVRNKPGQFSAAEGGTIFLDEIGDIKYSLQARLLRVLQEKTFTPLGSVKPVKVDVRIIAATNQNLEERLERGEFREDLYYRLNVIHLRIPPLRERPDDVLLLADYFLEKFSKSLNKNIDGFSREVRKIFQEYSWPGNVRELEHCVEHGVIFSESSIIKKEDLPVRLVNYKGEEKSKKADDPQFIKEILEKCRWNKAKAARLLGIDRSTLYRKIKKYGVVKSESVMGDESVTRDA